LPHFDPAGAIVGDTVSDVCGAAEFTRHCNSQRMIDAAGFSAFRRRGTLLALETRPSRRAIAGSAGACAKLSVATSAALPNSGGDELLPRASGWQGRTRLRHGNDRAICEPSRLNAGAAGAATVRPFSGSFTIGARLRVVLAPSWTTIQSFERLIWPSTTW
jgi:hypothetical protein